MSGHPNEWSAAMDAKLDLLLDDMERIAVALDHVLYPAPSTRRSAHRAIEPIIQRARYRARREGAA